MTLESGIVQPQNLRTRVKMIKSNLKRKQDLLLLKHILHQQQRNESWLVSCVNITVTSLGSANLPKTAAEHIFHLFGNTKPKNIKMILTIFTDKFGGRDIEIENSQILVRDFKAAIIKQVPELRLFAVDWLHLHVNVDNKIMPLLDKEPGNEKYLPLDHYYSCESRIDATIRRPDHVRCPSCFEGMRVDVATSEPIFLRCGHCVCLACFSGGCQHAAETSSDLMKFDCPTCFRVTYCPSDQPVAPIPSMMEVLELMEQRRLRDETSLLGPYPLCAGCGEVESTVNCRECRYNLCNNCNNSAHSFGLFRSHVRTLHSHGTVSDPLPVCTAHTTKPCQWYCRNDCCFVCEDCISSTGAHHGHAFASCGVVAPEIRTRLNDDVTDPSSLKILSDELIGRMNKIAADTQVAITNEVQEYDLRIAALIKERDDKIATIKQKSAVKELQCVERMKELSKTLSEINIRNKYISLLLSKEIKDNDVGLLELYTDKYMDSDQLLKLAMEPYRDVIKLKESLSSGDIELNNTKGNSLLMDAVKENQLYVVEYLIEKGAEKDGKNKDEWTPLHVASEKGYLPIVQFLVDNGADIESEERNGCTPLYFAVLHNQLAVVKYLVEKGANIDSKPIDRLTPRQLAHEFSRELIIDYFNKL